MNDFYDRITEFIFVEDEPALADVILVPGSGTVLEHVRTAARLFQAGYAPYILPSGKYAKALGHFPGTGRSHTSSERISQTSGWLYSWADNEAGASTQIMPEETFSEHEREEPQTEWSYMRNELLSLGVPAEKVLREDQATFTWENAIFSRKVLEKAGIQVHTAILCCQAFHAARCLMYYQQQFPEVNILVVPTVTRDIRRDNWFLDEEKTDVVLGEVKRIGDQFTCMLPLGGGRPYQG